MYWVVVQWHSFWMVLLRPGALGLNRAQDIYLGSLKDVYGSQQYKGVCQ